MKLSDGTLPSSSLDFATTADGAHVVFGDFLVLYSGPLSPVGPRVLLDTALQRASEAP